MHLNLFILATLFLTACSHQSQVLLNRDPASIEPIEPHDVVVTLHGNYGRVVTTDAEHAMVYFFRSEKEYKLSYAEFAKIEGCSRDLCVGTPVKTKTKQNPGIVKGIFKNGDVLVLFFNTNTFYKWKPSNLDIIP